MSRTRSPKRSRSPRVSPNTLPPAADVDSGDEHSLVVVQLVLERALWMASIVRNNGRVCAGRRFGSRRDRGAQNEVGRALGDGRRRLGARSRASSSSAATDDSSASSSASVTPAARRAAPVQAAGSRCLPVRHLFGRPVTLRITLVVAVPAVGRRLDQRLARRRARRSMTASCIAAAVATTSLPSELAIGEGVARGPVLERRARVGRGGRELGVAVVLAEEDHRAAATPRRG